MFAAHVVATFARTVAAPVAADVARIMQQQKTIFIAAVIEIIAADVVARIAATVVV